MLTIIKIEPLKNGQHLMESQSHRTTCWVDGYVEVPSEMADGIWETGGYCDLTIEDGVLVGYTPTERPEPEPKPEPEASVEERVTALEDAITKGLSL